jgi:hypothetical protein
VNEDKYRYNIIYIYLPFASFIAYTSILAKFMLEALKRSRYFTDIIDCSLYSTSISIDCISYWPVRWQRTDTVQGKTSPC